MQQNERFGHLFTRYAEKKYSADEKDELFRMIHSGEYEDILRQLVQERWDMDVPEWIRENEDQKAEAIFQAVLQRVRVKKLISLRRIAVAASILLVVGMGSYFLFFNKTEKKNAIVKAGDHVPEDIAAPKATRAMITLTDGRQLELDSLASGSLVTQGSVQVIKNSNGEIVYSGKTDEVAYNTLYNPRGSKVVSIRLSDGTQVWLNAESSLKYPIAFTGNERSVEITGEAYFEVAKDKTKKFFVNANDVRTEVLGTHFNVNSFTDEGIVKITLLEGSIKVTKGTASGLLKPGQQAQVASEVAISNEVDLEEVMAWKNGRFVFANATVDAVMNQVARWYDVDIAYEGAKPSAHFIGDISRLENVSELLKMLEQTKAVKFGIEGRRIIVRK